MAHTPTPPVIPRHVAIIMDGNGRWARARSLPRVAGHEAGSKAIGHALEAARDCGVEFLTLYAFSTENWKRPKDEVDALMRLLIRFLDERTSEMMEKNVRLHTIGRTSELPEKVQERLVKAKSRSAANTGLQVILALNYSGRTELVDAARALARRVRQGELDPESIDEDTITAHLHTAAWPDPDLLIRTSGELRLSNFLLWQLSYTEIHVTEKLWPDFKREDFLAAVADYGTRHRRFGGI
jgi:undecaprenyl diphosphate synthase